ncbi:MAG: CbtB-domain containing protein [Rhodospirillaceae bacterium]
MQKQQTTTQGHAPAVLTARKIPAILALVFGAFVVLGVGFAHSSTIHNAAHDARHAFAFPCH